MVLKLYEVRLSEGEDGIKVVYDASLLKNEYVIEGATVKASDAEGAAYGLATMLQLMEKTEDGFDVRNTEIRETPDKDFRAFMSDLARQWHDFDVLLSYVDLCYLNKVKYLQLHFTDNQSWTLPLACFPDAATKGRCYKRSEIDYLVEYAHEAGVELIPEFEGIGHSKELIQNCPDAFSNLYDEEIEDTSVENAVGEGNLGLVDNIMCIGRENIFLSVQSMLAEIAEIFKYSKYIHVGCDEAKHENWSHCSLCRAYMARQGIKDTKALYSHFVSKIIDICISLGKTPIVWEGFPYEGTENISRDAVVVSWENYYQTGPELIESGFSVINASWSPMYIVPIPDDPERSTWYIWSVLSKNWDVHQVQHHWIKSKAYGGGLPLTPPEKVLGGMLCQWECNPAQERDRLILNLPMMADRTWNASGYYEEEEFYQNSGKILALSEKLYRNF